ncbi:hypothetical protein CRM22_007858 [Opisthorchis felineus]|uniref:Uncharacterized protein n=1 Tax=Opisthorchis felineus TaxID=147828 RepID=A0A4S2LLV2_OPIFE|nr:hypothetical protein CRM22_007858 [Opisthorchis felineus]
MIKEHPFPTRRRNGNAVFSCSVNVLGFITMVGGFVSPYWLQSYSRIHMPFSRLGLWEFCLNGFVPKNDISMQSYYGCWWIYSPYLDAIRDILTPWWFIIIQVFMSVSLFLYFLSVILFFVYLFGEFSNSKVPAVLSLSIALIDFTAACLITTSIIIFGINQLNPDWMPYPFQNWPSSGFGLAALSGCLAFITTGYSAVQYRIDKELHEEDAFNFPLVTRPQMEPEVILKSVQPEKHSTCGRKWAQRNPRPSPCFRMLAARLLIDLHT